MRVGSESETVAADRSCEIAAVLFTDIVSYSMQAMDQQSELLTALQKIVKSSAEFQQARAREAVITLPTGDGMALVFFGDPVSPVRCALQIAESLRSQPDLKLRMGVHSGPVFRHADIKDELNVVGGGINMAQRVMDCGDAGHILVSGNVAEILLQLSAWRDAVHDLGVFEVKHGVKVHIYNLYKDGLGKLEAPRKLPVGAGAAPATAKKPARHWKGLALAVAGLLVAVAVWVKLHPPPPPPPPEAERTLYYYVDVQRYRDGKQESFRLNGPRIFEAGYLVRLVFSSPQAGYLYILNEGPESTPGKPLFNTLFPSPVNNGGSALLEVGKELQIPQGNERIKFDNEKGVEKLWLVWAKQSVAELEPLKEWLTKTGGEIKDPAQLQSIGSFLVKNGHAEPTVVEDEAQKRTVIKGKSDILVSLLKLEHE